MRYGYRRVHVLVLREGWQIKIKKASRVYNELGLQFRNMRPKRLLKAKLAATVPKPLDRTMYGR